MRTLAIITGKCILSARKLAEGINKRSHGEWKATVFDVRKVNPPIRNDHTFSYGCSDAYPGIKSCVNTINAVKRCVSKIDTFRALAMDNIPIPRWTRDKQQVGNEWERIVVRSKVNGRKAEDLEFFHQGDKLPDAPLYTEYFPHKYEYRIVVFMGKVVGRYYKKVITEPDKQINWSFEIQPQRGFDLMDDACLKAAKALGIDFVGFDVVANTKKDFVILEANSGPILTGEAEEAIINYYLNLQ